MPGPQPSENPQRRNRKATASVIEAAPAQKTAGKPPPLGAFRPDFHEVIQGGKLVRERTPWHPETRRWWSTIWRSAVAGRFIDAHVPALVALARLVDDFWRAETAAEARALHSELRMAVREFGLTPMAARALGWEFRRPLIESGPTAPKLPPGADPRKILDLSSRRAG